MLGAGEAAPITGPTSVLDQHWGSRQKGTAAAAMTTLGLWMMDFSADYTNDVVGGFPHDGFIAQEAELYPQGATVLRLFGMSHVQEIAMTIPEVANWIVFAQ
jgi:hypothetical protein